MANDWKFNHVGAVVSDVDRVVEYYQSIGLVPVDPPPPEGMVVQRDDEPTYGKLIPFSLKVRGIRIGNLPIELIQPIEGKGLHMNFLDSRGEGLQHINFALDEDGTKKARAFMLEKGVPVALTKQDSTQVTYYDTSKGGNFWTELAWPLQRREIPTSKENWELRYLGVIVRDVEKTREYWESLGVAKFRPERIEPEAGRTDELIFGKLFPFKVRIFMADIGDLTLIFIQPIEGRGIHMEYLDRHGEGIMYANFNVDDLEKERAELVKKGVSVALRRKDGSITFFDTTRHGNITVELLQRQ